MLTHSPLDWNGLDFGKTIEVDRKLRYTLEKIYSSFVKEVSNCRISREDKENFLNENFDPSSFFSGYAPIVKKVKLELGCITQSQCDHLVEAGIRSVEVQASTSTQGAVYAEKVPASQRKDVCFKRLVAPGFKRKRVRSSQRVVVERSPINRHKITVLRSSYKYKISQIEQLKSEVRRLKGKSSNVNKDLIDNAVATATQELEDKIENLAKTIEDCDKELAKKDEKIAKLKSKYKNLKDDYDSETFKHFEEIEEMRNKTEMEESDEILETFDNTFNLKKVPQMKMRFGPKKINMDILKILVILRLGLGLSLQKCVMCLVLVGNHTFGQKWTLPKNKEYKQNDRANRCMPAPPGSNAEQETPNEGKSGRYKDIDDYTAPAPTFLKKIIETVMEPSALGSIFAELKDPDTQYSTIGADHFVEHRQKHQTQGLITSKLDPKTGKSTVGYRSLGLTNVFKTTANATFEHIKRIFQLGAILTAKSEDADDILTSLKEILAKVKFSVTDGASNMKGAIDNLSEWHTEMTGITNDFIWIHCNAHVLPALTGATEKNLKEVVENA